MPYDEALAKQVRAVLAGEPGVTEKSMFGTRAFLVEGNLATTVREHGLLVRVGLDWMDDAIARGATPAQMGRRTMKGWVHVDPGDELAEWVARGVAFARAVGAQRP